MKNKVNPTILAEKVRDMSDEERLNEFGIEILDDEKVINEFGVTYKNLIEWARDYNESEDDSDYVHVEKFGGKGGKEYF